MQALDGIIQNMKITSENINRLSNVVEHQSTYTQQLQNELRHLFDDHNKLQQTYNTALIQIGKLSELSDQYQNQISQQIAMLVSVHEELSKFVEVAKLMTK